MVISINCAGYIGLVGEVSRGRVACGAEFSQI